MGFYHHHTNRISLRKKKKNDSLCNSGGYMAMSSNKQGAVTVSVSNICGNMWKRLTGPTHNNCKANCLLKKADPLYLTVATPALWFPPHTTIRQN